VIQSTRRSSLGTPAKLTHVETPGKDPRFQETFAPGRTSYPTMGSAPGGGCREP